MAVIPTIQNDDPEFTTKPRDVRGEWIGGGQWAGKSTVARLLAIRYGLTAYHYDYHDARGHNDRRIARRVALSEPTADPDPDTVCRSDRPGTGYDIDTLADDLGYLLERLDLSDVTLVGHSMGAAEVVRYLTRHGNGRVARVVLSAPTTPYLPRTPDNPDGLDADNYRRGREVLLRDAGHWLDRSNSAEYFAGSQQVSQAMIDWTRRQILDTSVHVLIETNDAFFWCDSRAELSEINVPTLIIHGAADTATPVELTGRRTASLISGSRLVVFDGAGHGLYLSESRRYNSALIEFITEGRSAHAHEPAREPVDQVMHDHRMGGAAAHSDAPVSGSS